MAHVQASDFLVEAMDRAPVLVFVADDEMRYVAVNRRACEVLGYTREELLELRVPDIAEPVEARHLYPKMQRERGHAGSAHIRDKGGRTHLFHYWSGPAGDGLWISCGVLDHELPSFGWPLA